MKMLSSWPSVRVEKLLFQSQRFVHMPLLFRRHGKLVSRWLKPSAEVLARFRSGGKGTTKEDPSKTCLDQDVHLVYV